MQAGGKGRIRIAPERLAFRERCFQEMDRLNQRVIGGGRGELDTPQNGA
jgi:hypothetical protein